MRLLTIIAASVLFVIFSLAAALSWLFAIGGLLLGRTRYAANIMHSQDMLLAAVLGWDGRSTVSKECGRQILAGTPCRFCRFVCGLTHRFLEKLHCEKEAAR